MNVGKSGALELNKSIYFYHLPEQAPICELFLGWKVMDEFMDEFIEGFPIKTEMVY